MIAAIITAIALGKNDDHPWNFSLIFNLRTSTQLSSDPTHRRMLFWGSRINAMQEVLSRPGECEKPLSEQEYWLIELRDWTEDWRAGFLVQQARAKWSAVNREFILEDIESERWALLIDAEERYEARRLVLVSNGFIRSDLDL